MCVCVCVFFVVFFGGGVLKQMLDKVILSRTRFGGPLRVNIGGRNVAQSPGITGTRRGLGFRV